MVCLLTTQRGQNLEQTKNSASGVISPLVELFTSYAQNYGGVFLGSPDLAPWIRVETSAPQPSTTEHSQFAREG